MSLEGVLAQTMLIERLIGVGVYAFVLLFVGNYLMLRGRRAAKRLLICYALIIGLMGFFFIPGPDADLTRLLEYMHSWAEMSFLDAVDYALDTSTPAYVMYFWVIGQFGVDGLLPGITVLLGHLLIFSCLWDYMNRIEAGNKSAAWSVVFLMSTAPFIGFVSGIRNSLAFAIVFRLIYRELAMGKGIAVDLSFYAFAALLHPAALAYVLVRFVFMMFQRKRNRIDQLVSVVVLVACVAFAVGYGSSYIDAMLEKGSNYVSGGVYSYIWEILIRAICLAFIVYAFAYWRRLTRLISGDPSAHELLKRGNLYNMVFVLMLVAVASIPFGYTLFTRSVAFLTLFAPIVIMSVAKIASLRPSVQMCTFVRVLRVVSIVLLFISCSRGNMSGYKFLLFE